MISTLERAESLRRTLNALRYQTHPAFEVIVVEGPSADDCAERAVREFGDSIRYLRCPDANLSRSRNIGVAAASCDVVAFLDDDAVAEPRWLEQLAAAYDQPDVAGAGGVVINHTGAQLQYEFSVCDRLGCASFDRSPPFTQETVALADPFVYLQGTNMSFRRDRLAQIGGFDEEIEYSFDDVEVCARLIDHGSMLRPLDGAAVHHGHLPSRIRNADRVCTDPFALVKNRVYFALRYGRQRRSLDAVMHELHRHCRELRTWARMDRLAGRLSEEEYEFFLERLEAGFEHGIVVGLSGERKGAVIGAPDRSAYRPFACLRPSGKRLRVCFLSHQYPPRDFGAIGRYTSELSSGLAALGHEVHVFSDAGDGADRVSFEDGVWLHRTRVRRRWLGGLRRNPAAENLALIAARYRAVSALHQRAPVDVVWAPLWLGEGVCCSLDQRFPTITTLSTSVKTMVDVHPSLGSQPQTGAMLRLERETLAHASCLHAVSSGVLDELRRDYPETISTPTFVAPVGIADCAARAEQAPLSDDPNDNNGVSILFVDRLERRTGVDVLLDAIPRVLAEFPDAKLVVAGKDTADTEQSLGYRETFLREHADDPALLGRVRFAGGVSDSQLRRLYAGCDVFCAPSRFESLGLVLLEAMMFGKPIVASAVGATGEIVEHEVTGLLAAPGDASSLSDCLSRLLSDGEARLRYGRAARLRFLERYEISGATGRMVQELTSVVEAHASKPSGLAEHRARFADVIAAVADVDRQRARRAANELLDPRGSRNAGASVDVPYGARRVKVGKRIIAAERFLQTHVLSRRSIGRRVDDLENFIDLQRREGAGALAIAAQAAATVYPLRSLRVSRALRARRRAPDQRRCVRCRSRFSRRAARAGAEGAFAPARLALARWAELLRRALRRH